MGLVRRPRFAWKKRSNIFTFLLVFVFLFQYFLQIYNLSSGQVLAQDTSEEVQQEETDTTQSGELSDQMENGNESDNEEETTSEQQVNTETPLDAVVDRIEGTIESVKDGVEDMVDTVDETAEKLLGIDLIKDKLLIKESVLTDTFTNLEPGFGDITLELESDSVPLKEENVDDIDTTEDIQEDEKGTGNYELNTGVNLKTEYTLKEESEAVKQLVIIENFTEETILTNLEISTELKLNPYNPIVYWDDEEYEITDTPTIFQAFEKTAPITEFADDIGEGDLEGIEEFSNYEHTYIAGTGISFTTEDNRYGSYDWSDVSEMEHEVKVQNVDNKFILTLVLKNIDVNANSEYVIDPIYDLTSASSYDARFDGATDDNRLPYEGALAIGDVNDDGIDDLVLGSIWSDHLSRTDNGVAYVIFGNSDSPHTGNKPFNTSSNYNIRYIGAVSADNLTGTSVSGAAGRSVVIGDVNGDNKNDLVVGALYASNNGSGSGSAYVFFSTLIDDVGVSTGNDFDLATGSSYNIRYDGETGSDNLTDEGAMAIGDINGDGYGDLVLGSRNADNNGAGSGSAWVMFSTLIDDVVEGSTGNDFELTSVSTECVGSTAPCYNIRYDGGASGENLTSGSSIRIGDVNGDSNSDLLLGAYGADYNGGSSGSAYVILSTLIDDVVEGSTGNDFELTSASTECVGSAAPCYNIRYDGGVASDTLTYEGAVAIGDLNGDSKSDLVLGSQNAGNNGADSGSAWVMFSTLIDDVTGTGNNKPLDEGGNYNIRYDGGAAGEELTEYGVIGIGDVNYDGLGDLVLGTISAAYNGASSGSAYVMYSTLIDDVVEGSTGNDFELTSSSTECVGSTAPCYNVRFDGAEASDLLTLYTSFTLGDVNGDGFGDLVLGAPWADNNSRANSGSVWVIHSSLIKDITGTGNNKPLDEVANYSNRYDGAIAGDDLSDEGGIVVGNLDGSVGDDLILGAKDTDYGDTQTGSVYAVYASPPVISLTALSPDPTSETTPSLNGTATDSNVTVSLVEFQMDGTDGSWTACTADDGTFDEASEAFTCTVVTALTDGSHTMYVRATDSDDHITSAANASTDTFTVSTDSEGPAGITLETPTNYTNNGKPNLKFKKSTDSDVSSYSVSLDAGKTKSYSISGIPSTGDGSSSSYTWRDDNDTRVVFTGEDTASTTDDEIEVTFKGLDVNNLPKGRHSWRVNATDTNSNVSETSTDFSVDTEAPSTDGLTISTDAGAKEVSTGGVYNLSTDTDSKARNPTFSGKVKDAYVGGSHTYGDGSTDTFDKVSSGPKKLKVDVYKLKDGQQPDEPSSAVDDSKYDHYLTDEHDLSDVVDIAGERKESEFSVTPSSDLADGYYKVNLTQTDYADNGGSFGPFVLGMNYRATTPITGTPIPTLPSPTPTPFPTPQPPPVFVPSITPTPTPEAISVRDTFKDIGNRLRKFIAGFGVKEVRAWYQSRSKLLEHLWVTRIPGKSKTKIKNVKVRYITETSAIVTWRTNHAAISYLNYGETTDLDAGRVNTLKRFPSRRHSAYLTNLTPDTPYFFNITAKGRTRVTWGPGAFTTLPLVVEPPLPTPEPTPSPEPTLEPTPTPTGTPSPTPLGSPTSTPTISPVPTSTAPPAPEDGEVEEIVFEDLPDEAPDEIVPFIVQDVRTSVQDNETIVGSGTAATVVTAAGAAVVTTSAVVTTVPVVKTSYTVYRSVRTVSTTTLGVAAAWSYITGFVTNTLAALGFAKKKKRKTMGIIFDTATGKPVPGVYVTFTTSSGNLKSTVSNSEGRYSISLEPDTYNISVNKDDYKLASEEVTSMYSEVYEELYTPGTTITVQPNQPSPFVNLAIGIHPIAKSDTARKISTIPQRLGNALERHFYLFSIASFVISGYAYLVNPILLNQIVFYLVIAVMVIQTISIYIKNRTFGTVTKSGKPLPQATVELYITNKSGKEELYTATLTDNKGKYQFRPENGDYTLKVKDNQRKTIHTQQVTVTNTKPWVGERVGV